MDGEETTEERREVARVMDSHSAKEEKQKERLQKKKGNKGRRKEERRMHQFLKKRKSLNAKFSCSHVLGILDDCHCRIDK